MKKTLFIIIALVIGFGFSSCEKKITSGGATTKTVYLPILELTGDATMILEIGDTYTEPGATATAAGKDLDVTTVGTVNTAVAGQYIVTYSAESPDGYAADVSRTVWVVPPTGDLTTSISGYYISTSNNPGYDESHEGLKYVLIEETGNTNEYTISHGLGGFYAMGRGYGPDYASVGTVFTYDFSTFTEISGGAIPPFGVTSNMSSFVLDAATKTITFTGTGSWGAVFLVTLTQQ